MNQTPNLPAPVTVAAPLSLPPDRASYVCNLADDLDIPEYDVLLSLSHDEMRGYVYALGEKCADELTDQLFSELLTVPPFDKPLIGDERDVRERIVIALARAISANWPFSETNKRGSRVFRKPSKGFFHIV